MMKKNVNLLNVCILLSCTFLLCSCLSINRNIKINNDGSGTEVLSVTFDKMFYEMMASMTSFMDSTRRQGFLDSLYSDEIFIDRTKLKYDSMTGIQLINISSLKNSDSSNTFVIEYNYDSISKIASSLNRLNSNSNDTDSDSSTTTVTFTTQGQDVFFNYTYIQSKNDNLQSSDSLSEQMKTGMAEIFSGDNINFEIEFPYTVVSSNASSVKGNKLFWNFTISDIITNNKMNLEVRMRKN